MARFQNVIFCVFLVFCLVFSLAGCGEREKSDKDLVVGNWIQFRNRAYILLITSPKGTWHSSVRIADATSKIVKAKGNAQGSWHMEEGQLIFTVTESDIQEIWEKNNTSFFEIVELGEEIMLLKEESGRVVEWKKTNPKKSSEAAENLAVIIPMQPIAVNLNKVRSNTQDRFLCLKMEMVLKELMPDQEIPAIHPRAREAVIIFLSSLIYNDVKDFEQVKIQKSKLVDVLNPYMEGFIKDIKITHVIISTTMEKVEEFILEHTVTPEINPEEESGENKKEEKSSEK
jgi:flagellar basal body-associated protein FliL